jgi:hypothetical protein
MDETTYEDDQGLSNSAGIRGTGRREFIGALEEKVSYPTPRLILIAISVTFSMILNRLAMQVLA